MLWPSGGAVATVRGPALVVTLAITFVVFLVGGPLQEEPGWRGFALPRLQQRLQPTAAAIVLGVVHCVWHAPLFLTREWDTPRRSPLDLLAYLLLVVSLSVVLAWGSNSARGSLLPAILGHNSVNWTLTMLPVVTGRSIDSVWPAALGLSALALMSTGATRGRLGYPGTPTSAPR